MNENRKERAALAIEQATLEAALAVDQQKVMEKLAGGDTDTADQLVRDCISMVTDDGNTIFSLSPDRKDAMKVRDLLKGLNPYDLEKKLRYVELPVMNDQEFLADLTAKMLQGNRAAGDVKMEFSINYVVEGFAGIVNAWGILICPVRGGKPYEPEIESLYVE